MTLMFQASWLGPIHILNIYFLLTPQVPRGSHNTSSVLSNIKEEEMWLKWASALFMRQCPTEDLIQKSPESLLQYLLFWGMLLTVYIITERFAALTKHVGGSSDKIIILSGNFSYYLFLINDVIV